MTGGDVLGLLGMALGVLTACCEYVCVRKELPNQRRSVLPRLLASADRLDPTARRWQMIGRGSAAAAFLFLALANGS